MSEKMLGRARAETPDATIAYVRADLEQLALAPASFDLIYSSLALHYVERLSEFQAEVHRGLAPTDGSSSPSSTPVFTVPAEPGWSATPAGRRTWAPDGYLEEGPRSTDWLAKGVIKQHRMLATYLNTLLKAGFALARVEEWGPTPEQIAAKPVWADERRRPPFLLVSARR